MKKILSDKEADLFLKMLQQRFEKNRHRHKEINWSEAVSRLVKYPDKLWSIHQMEITGGEPDVIGYDKTKKAILICDCAIESPKGRRSLCYDQEALKSRKEHKPTDSASNQASEMGIELLDEEQCRYLQSLENADTKTSSWLKTPATVREQGGAFFGDFRYGRVFIYHNGAESYYAARGFRGLVKI